MSDEPPPRKEPSQAVSTTRHEREHEHDFEETDLPPALRTLIELERERIESANRRTDVVRLAIQTNDASDKRQFEFRMAKLDADRLDRGRRHDLAQKVIYSATGVGVVMIALLFGMAFFGTPGQSETAIEILKIAGIGTAGYGLIAAVVRLVGRLFKSGE